MLNCICSRYLNIVIISRPMNYCRGSLEPFWWHPIDFNHYSYIIITENDVSKSHNYAAKPCIICSVPSLSQDWKSDLPHGEILTLISAHVFCCFWSHVSIAPIQGVLKCNCGSRERTCWERKARGRQLLSCQEINDDMQISSEPRAPTNLHNYYGISQWYRLSVVDSYCISVYACMQLLRFHLVHHWTHLYKMVGYISRDL